MAILADAITRSDLSDLGGHFGTCGRRLVAETPMVVVGALADSHGRHCGEEKCLAARREVATRRHTQMARWLTPAGSAMDAA